MVFSSVTFLCLFLPVFLAMYFLVRNITYRNIILVAFSLLFYAWGEPVWIVAMLFSAATDYVCGRVIDKSSRDRDRGGSAERGEDRGAERGEDRDRDRGAGRSADRSAERGADRGSKIALALSIVINLGILTAFKYSGFIIRNINFLLGAGIPAPGFNLPLGISFYTFQTLSYTIDMYRGKTTVQKNFLSFLCYVTMFPQLVAGPIVRYGDIADGLRDRKVTKRGFSAGITRFAVGLAKKTMLANPAGAAATALLADVSGMTTASAWLGIIMFAFQIYFDFSGYSDMAIGIGKMIGFNFRENFNYPYEARSITDFWRRWHISLGSFFRDYVYVPLGGNRRYQARNIALVWLLTGLWHGASWNFVFWGAYFGAALMFEKYILRAALDRVPLLFARCYTIIVLLVGWGLFYYTDFAELAVFMKALLFINTPLTSFLPRSILAEYLWLIVVLAAASTSLPKRAVGYLVEIFPGSRFTEPVFAAACTLTSLFMLVGQTYNPFLYFRF